MFYLPVLLLWTGIAISWIAYWRVGRRETLIRQTSPDYAEQVFRTGLFTSFLFRGRVRLAMVLLLAPPAPLADAMRPVRTTLVVAACFFTGAVVAVLLMK